MRIFKCQACGQLLFFENVVCERCKHRLGYMPEPHTLSALEPAADETWTALHDGSRQRFCVNAEHDACNWLIPAESQDAFCLACRHNGTIPSLADAASRQAWQKIEFAKHHLFYSLTRLKLPLATRAEHPEGLIFAFLADPPSDDGPKVMTGHDNGLITIALSEADDVERERRRTAMGEPYRTLLGHFRHEVGHYFWDRLVRDGGQLEACRAIFGDDSLDYGEALKAHYEKGVPANWQEDFISAYATTHPWEDFAETWAHYLHIVDTLEMASAFDLRVEPRLDQSGQLAAMADIDPYQAVPFERIITPWLPIAFAMNSINRCMGQADLYPFILTPRVIEKLGFIHGLVHGAKTGNANA